MIDQTDANLDIYSLITGRIIDLLKGGTIPWRQPWTEAGVPRNLISGRPYRGINLMLLNAMGYEHNLFMTWKQIKTISASVKRGETGTIVIFQKMVDEKRDGVSTGKKKFILRYYKVFNVAQCTNIPKGFFPEGEEKDNTPLWECEQTVENMKDCPEIRHVNDNAYYVPAMDYINMPAISRFENSESYYGILFHELVHSTGHKKRVGRKEVYENPEFGTEPYSLEELVAEMGACYLKSHVGLPIDKLENSAAYIQNWLEVFEGDNQFVIKAASFAQRAVEYILKATGEDEHKES